MEREHAEMARLLGDAAEVLALPYAGGQEHRQNMLELLWDMERRLKRNE
jgi:hypothetical protein